MPSFEATHRFVVAGKRWRVMWVSAFKLDSHVDRRECSTRRSRDATKAAATANASSEVEWYDHYASLAASTDFAKHPEFYRVGRGEQGVLMVEPYKSKLLPLWRFATVALAETSSAALLREFRKYVRNGDFVGADMARKFIQMGYTRARRYANHRGGRKYDTNDIERPREPDDEKAASARVFYAAWKKAREDAKYLRMKKEHQAKYG